MGVTAVAMFGAGAGWGLGFQLHTLSVAVGGIAKRPIYLQGVLVEREFLQLTVCGDHDVVDGARTAARTREGAIMSKSTTTDVRRAPASSKGWFVWMTGLWIVFFVLMNNGQLDDLATWIRDLPIVFEILVWIVFFPQVLATAVWTSGWSEGLRITLVTLFVLVWALLSIPRPKTSGRR